MLDLRPPGAGVLSPDGKRLYFSWRVTGVDQVWRLDGADRFPLQLTGGEDRTTIAAVSPDGRWLALERDRQGEENPGFYLQAADGGPLREVQHRPGVQTEFQHFSADSRFAYYVSNDVSRDSYAVYRYDIGAARAERLFDGQGFWRVADVQPGRLLLVKATGSRGREWSLFDEATRSATPLLGQGEYSDYVMRFGARPGHYVVVTSKSSGFLRVYEWAAGQSLTPVAVPGGERWDVEGLLLDRARKRLYLTINEAGYTRVQVLDATTLQPLPLPWPAGLDHQIVAAASADGEQVVLALAPPDRPRETAVWNWRDRTLTRWTVPSTPEADTRQFAPATLESYPARDGTPIPMFVRRPARCLAAAEPPCPVIVHFHGGPESQSKPGFSPIWQFFVEAGFVIVEPNVRGSSGYGKAWLDADNGAKRLQVITDIEDAALHLRSAWTRNGVAPRIGVYGGSYGGYAALMAMTRFAGAYDAGVSNVGIANLLSFIENTAPYRRQLRVTEYGDPATDREAMIQLSPTRWVHQLKAPLMIVQGANDPRVPVGEALQMHEVARARGVPLELLLFADEGHGASTRANQALQWGHVLRFFQQHLPGR
ncbi:S9 family peptidase [Aquincola sp. S2]|uniref:S9 family peptidase n=1 Tax=Pseudaquabacterium terrae TaxID=2732868 RepID=A0ABX2EK63_9BURK|nr:S9 family peptidase [Aquabacterium terrae]